MPETRKNSMQNLSDILKKIKKFIARCRKEARLSLNDTTAAQWEKIDFITLEPLLSSLGIESSLSEDWKQYHKKAKTILKKTDVLENELGNIEADIRLSSVNPKKAKGEAQRLAAKCVSMEPLLVEMLKHRARLRNAAARLKEDLTLHTFINLARERVNQQALEAFETGYQYYLIVSGEKGDSGKAVTLEGYFQAASGVDKKINELELPELPLLVKDIIQQQIKICHEAGVAIRIFLDFCGESFRQELSKINEFNKKLDVLRQKNISDIIDSAEEMADSLCKLLRNFFYKSYLIKELVKVEMLLQNLKQFHHVFNGNFLKELGDRINQPDSPINPAVLAGKTSADFFFGMKGVIRMIKLLYGSMTGRKTINEKEFQELLKIIITSCESYYRKDKDAAEKMDNFINSYLEGYHKPFPFDDLVTETRKAIELYGETVEKYIFQTMINPLPVESSGNEKQPAPRPISLGRLIGKIEARGAVLTKIQHDQENMA